MKNSFYSLPIKMRIEMRVLTYRIDLAKTLEEGITILLVNKEGSLKKVQKTS